MKTAIPNEAAAIAHILRYPEMILNREFLYELFTAVDRLYLDDAGQINTKTPMYVGKLFVKNDRTLHRTLSFEADLDDDNAYTVVTEETGIRLPDDPKLPILDGVIWMQVKNGDIANFTGDNPIDTTIGRFILNYILLAVPFGDIIPYKQEWDPSKLEKELAQLLVTEKITAAHMRRYAYNVPFLHALEFCIPSITRKAISVDPEVIKFRDKLVAEKREALEAGDAVEMAKVEKALIEKDRASFAGDPSTRILVSKKNFDVHRKTMYLTEGMSEVFDGNGAYTWTNRALREGWSKKDFAKTANKIRAGSQSRALETAKGGEEAKFLTRMFQNTRITEDDCGSRIGYMVDITRETKGMFEFRYRMIGNGKLDLLTATNLGGFENLSINVRSPMYCRAQNGYCAVCMGQKFRSLRQYQLTIPALDLGSTFTLDALKKAHGTSVDTVSVHDISSFMF